MQTADLEGGGCRVDSSQAAWRRAAPAAWRLQTGLRLADKT